MMQRLNFCKVDNFVAKNSILADTQRQVSVSAILERDFITYVKDLYLDYLFDKYGAKAYEQDAYILPAGLPIAVALDAEPRYRYAGNGIPKTPNIINNWELHPLPGADYTIDFAVLNGKLKELNADNFVFEWWSDNQYWSVKYCNTRMGMDIQDARCIYGISPEDYGVIVNKDMTSVGYWQIALLYNPPRSANAVLLHDIQLSHMEEFMFYSGFPREVNVTALLYGTVNLNRLDDFVKEFTGYDGEHIEAGVNVIGNVSFISA